MLCWNMQFCHYFPLAPTVSVLLVGCNCLFMQGKYMLCVGYILSDINRLKDRSGISHLPPPPKHPRTHTHTHTHWLQHIVSVIAGLLYMCRYVSLIVSRWFLSSWHKSGEVKSFCIPGTRIWKSYIFSPPIIKSIKSLF